MSEQNETRPEGEAEGGKAEGGKEEGRQEGSGAVVGLAAVEGGKVVAVRADGAAFVLREADDDPQWKRLPAVPESV